MLNGQIILPKRRRKRDYREIAIKGSWSVIFVILALIAMRPLMVSQILDRAEAYADFGLNDDCLRQCNKALLLDGDNSRAWHRLARIYKAQGNREMAYEAKEGCGQKRGKLFFLLQLMSCDYYNRMIRFGTIRLVCIILFPHFLEALAKCLGRDTE